MECIVIFVYLRLSDYVQIDHQTHNGIIRDSKHSFGNLENFKKFIKQKICEIEK